MWCARQNLASGIGHWHPLIFAPYYGNAMVGGNPFGSALPQLTHDAGTPLAMIVIPVDEKLAVGAEMNRWAVHRYSVKDGSLFPRAVAQGAH